MAIARTGVDLENSENDLKTFSNKTFQSLDRVYLKLFLPLPQMVLYKWFCCIITKIIYLYMFTFRQHELQGRPKIHFETLAISVGPCSKNGDLPSASRWWHQRIFKKMPPKEGPIDKVVTAC